jgi:hypothetical protein
MDIDFLLLLGARIAPGLGEVEGRARDDVCRIIERAVAARPPRVQRQLAMFLSLLRFAPVARYGRPFERLSTDRQDAVLRWFQDARLPRLRQGFWGVKTLIYMGYYGRPDVGRDIAYRPSRTGNDLLDAR